MESIDQRRFVNIICTDGSEGGHRYYWQASKKIQKFKVNDWVKIGRLD